MTTTKVTTVDIAGITSLDSARVQYNTATTARSGNISLTHNGVTILFTSVAEFNTFMTSIVKPLIDTVNSVSGSGAGYVATVLGTAGADSVKDV